MAPHYAKGFSLWLMPAGEVVKKLEDIIGNLAGRYGSPKFPLTSPCLARWNATWRRHLKYLGAFPKG